MHTLADLVLSLLQRKEGQDIDQRWTDHAMESLDAGKHSTGIEIRFFFFNRGRIIASSFLANN